VVRLEYLDVCNFLGCLLLEKDQKVLHLFETGGLEANIYWGRRRLSRGLQLWSGKLYCRHYAIMQSCEAADYPRKALKDFDGHNYALI